MCRVFDGSNEFLVVGIATGNESNENVANKYRALYMFHLLEIMYLHSVITR